MRTSENTESLAAALAKAQENFESISKNKIGQEGLQKFPYSTLSAVLEAVRPALNAEKIFLSQPIIVDGNNQQRVTTRVQLNDQWMQTDGVAITLGLVGSKQFGREVTYSKRYDLMSFLGVCAEEDDKDAPDLKSIQNPSQPVIPKYGGQTGATVRNPSITNTDLPKEMFEQTVAEQKENTLAPDAVKAAKEMEDFVPLSEIRNTEIQARLKELVTAKIFDRKKLSLFLEAKHGQKKSFEVEAKTWEATMKEIEDAVVSGTAKELTKV